MQTEDVEEILFKLSKWNFKKTIDAVGSYAKGNDLYYVAVGSKRYWLLNHFARDTKSSQGLTPG